MSGFQIMGTDHLAGRPGGGGGGSMAVQAQRIDQLQGAVWEILDWCHEKHRTVRHVDDVLAILERHGLC